MKSHYPRYLLDRQNFSWIKRKRNWLIVNHIQKDTENILTTFSDYFLKMLWLIVTYSLGHVLYMRVRNALVDKGIWTITTDLLLYSFLWRRWRCKAKAMYMSMKEYKKVTWGRLIGSMTFWLVKRYLAVDPMVDKWWVDDVATCSFAVTKNINQTAETYYLESCWRVNDRWSA